MPDRTDSELLDIDVALLILAFPVYAIGSCVLAVAGWWNGRRDRRRHD